jgi:predicted ATPase/transcriptional regulator with XRE-family HTH domain
MATTSSTTFGALLRQHRLTAGLTQEALAERAGISARGVQDLERGVRRAPRAETVRLLAEALGLDADSWTTLIRAAHPELAIPPTPGAIPLPLAALPVPPTPLVGREGEIAGICALLRHSNGGAATRLVTLTGPGGVGKTRLAMAVAAALMGDYADGVAWVDLAPLRDSDVVASAIAHALGVREDGERPFTEGLALTLGDRHVLLVLDNCEHLLPAMPLLGQLLAACPQLAILATSRARLRLRGEREFPLGPLAVPPVMVDASSPLAELADVAAVRLFVARAAEVCPEFTLTAEHAAAVAAICRRLDGLPLALELAAARVKLLPPAALLARLEQRLALLAGGARDLPPRQQTMRDTIAWSHGLLTPHEQVLFRRLAVFVGGFTLEAAERVAGSLGGRVEGMSSPSPCDPATLRPSFAVFNHVASLVEQSLLRPIPGATDEPRYQMLETVREYASERLAASGEEAGIRDAHAAFCLALAERAELELTGPAQSAWLDRLEVEHDNLRAAQGWVSTRDAPTAIGVRLAGALWRFWWRRGHYREGRAWLEEALAQDVGTEAQRAKALYGAGSLATEQGDHEQATTLLEAALAAARTAGEQAVVALALTDLGSIARQQGAYERAIQFHGEALALRRESGDRRGIAVSMGNLGLPLLYQGEYGRAEALMAEAAAEFRDLGDHHSRVTIISNLAFAAVMRGDYERARALVQESLADYRAMGDHQGMADDLVTIGLAAQGQGDPRQAAALFGEALEHAREIGYKLGEAAALHRLGLAALDTGDASQALLLLGESLCIVRETGDVEEMAGVLDGMIRVIALMSPERAARLCGMAAALRETRGTTRPPAEQAPHERAVATIKRTLGEQGFTAASAAGRALPREDAIAEALAVASEMA